MPREARVQYPGAIYHVTVRMVGAAWETGREQDRELHLFRDDAERGRFLEQLGARVEAFDIRLYAYCLMLSHVHLYLETPKGNLSRFMQSLGTAYTVYSNLRRRRHGPLIGRYKAKPVESDAYHLSLSRYVHLNPVRTAAGSALEADEARRFLRGYSWSSYRAYMGRSKPPPWLLCGPILALCGRSVREAQRQYARFVEEALTEPDREVDSLLKSSPLGIGGAAFLDDIREQLIERRRQSKHPEDVRFRNDIASLDPETVLSVTARVLGADPAVFLERRRGSWLRGIASRMLCRYADLSQREAAATLGMRTGAAVGRQLRCLDESLARDRRLRRRVAACEAALRETREASSTKY